MAGRTKAASEQSAADRPRLLDLDAEEGALDARRQYVVAGGEHYDVRMPDEFTIAEKETFRVLLLQQRQIVATPVSLRDGDEGMTLDEREALLDLIEERLVRLAIVDCPDELALSPYKRNRIIEAFTAGLGDALLPLVWKVIDTALAPFAKKPEAANPAATNGTPATAPTSPASGAPQPVNALTTVDSSPASSTATAAG